MSSATRPSRRASLRAAVVLFVLVVAAPQAFAGAGGIGVIAGSSAIRAVRLVSTSPTWASCEGTLRCRHLGPRRFDMRPLRLDLRVPLPAKLELRSHVWNTTLESAELSVRESIVGPTLRRRSAGRWAELGVGVATLAFDRRDPADADRALVGAAVLAGAGVALVPSPHARMELRVRTGVGVGDGGAGVYHATLVLSVQWR